MANSLIRSNRLENSGANLKPKKKVTLSDLDEKAKPIEIEKVTFNTNIKISNHTRNRLQALANLGYASSQKDAIDLIFSAYLDTLLDSEKKELELQIDVLERKDAKLKKK
ncbi:DUF5388 domain-containing protein [Enterococcus sp. AZ102]|uniref:DUF5388 domain-containing protein n=1 Tax=Enterococcus sp. AZ102 TaxID=2774865 RepID=UPI003F214105